MCGDSANLPQPSPNPWRESVGAAAVAAHDRAVEAGRDGYIDPTSGFFVFTEVSLVSKGPCCESACRHCPYKDWSVADR